MSHYMVGVITHTGSEEEVTELLAPFDEGIEVKPYIRRTREQIIEDGKKTREQLIKRLETLEREELINILTKPSYRFKRELCAAVTDEQLYTVEVCSDLTDEDGNEVSTYNPDSKWDWWSIGGRWSDSLRDYDGNYWDTLQLKDWDFHHIDVAEVIELNRFWEVCVEGAERTEEEKENHKYVSFYKPEYYLDKYKTKSNYIRANWGFHTYALLTPDGEWLEPGQMGWFGMSNADTEDEFKWEMDYSKLIESFDQEMYITIVDCHI